MKKFRLFLCLIVLFALVGCTPKEEKPCLHEHCTWKWDEDSKCGKESIKYNICDDCGAIVDQIEEKKAHDYEVKVVEPTCLDAGYTESICKDCSYRKVTDHVDALGHDMHYVTDREPTSELCGIRHSECSRCDYKEEQSEFVNNGFSTHGALHVTGIDLMDSNNKKFRLVGFSTFGLQWQPEYVNYQTFSNLKNEFGINVIRLAMYTAEGGYCNGGEARKEQMYNTVVKGVELATELDMYVVVDWHMLGVDEGDNNPLFYKEESKEFFDRITKQFSDHDNILFEIMNEPCFVTWSDCKKYAEEVIPVIRKNMPNAIILVGNPQWSSDLASVAKDPIKNVKNIMYTLHFYANDNTATNKITTACGTNKLPVFITEHGGMGSDGDGTLNYASLGKWYDVLDKYNISFVAWSLSNLSTTSCIFKTGSKDIYDVSDNNLKTWGILYKARVREVMGLPIEKTWKEIKDN